MEDDALTPHDHAITPSTHVGPVIPGAVGDNYTDYVREHFGCQYDTEELMNEQERRFKARLIRVDAQELLELCARPDTHNPLECVHLVHACLRLGYTEEAMTLMEHVLAHEPYHAAVAYDEVCGQLAMYALDAGDEQRASRSIDRGVELLGEAWREASWWRGVLAWSAGDEARALKEWTIHVMKQEEGSERCDPERAYEVAAWLLRGEEPDERHRQAARDFLERSEQAARARGVRAVGVDIKLLKQRHVLS